MKFAGNRPVKIVMLGAGGTGGHIAPHLYRLLYALERPVRFIICDGDIVEEKNLVRQNFTPADLGENKAKALAERYSSVFGMETEYVPEFIESGERLLSMLRARTFPTGPYWNSPTVKELVILIGAVDNNKSRKLCHEVFYKLDDLIYIDSGNGMHTGQIVCGIRSGGRTFYRPVGAAYVRFENGLLTLRAKDCHYKAAVSINPESSIVFGFDARFMLDALTQFEKQDMVTMRLTSPLGAILLVAGNSSAIVLPVRLKEEQKAA